MTTDDYRRALATAIREYEALGQQRQDVDKRIAEVAQTIGTLSRLCGLVPKVPLGLTDACRLVVRGAGVPVTPGDVRQRLQSIGFDLSKYANDLAAIHTILKRLNGSGELRAATSLASMRISGITVRTRWCSAPTSPPSCATRTSSAKRCARTTNRRRPGPERGQFRRPRKGPGHD